ncbi:MAG: histidine kinase [Saprospiraceae bacterium]
MAQNPFIFSDEKVYRLRRHISFWVFWWLFFGILYSYTAKLTILPNFKRLPIALVDSAFFMLPHMFLAYSMMYFVIPRYLLKEKYLQAAGFVLLLFFITACFSATLGAYFLPFLRFHLFDISYFNTYNNGFLLSLLAGLRGAITIGGLASAIKLMKYWYLKEQRNLQLEKENAISQLELLKAQVHPHFLFNTLNNIYSYTQNTSPVAAQLVTGLSDLLRYVLYEGDQTLVPLSKELQMIVDYIELEKIRYGNTLELHLDLPKQSTGLYIAPLLLLPFVENCFKHGTSNMLVQPWITMKITLEQQVLKMKLVNGKINKPDSKKDITGIGLENVKKRLELIYPGKHELTITNDEEVFIVNLKVDLTYMNEDMVNQNQKLSSSHV